MIFLIAQHLKAFLKLWLSAVALHLFYFQYFNNSGGNSFYLENTPKISHQVESFQESWCRIHRARVNLDQILSPCFHNISWNGPSPTNRELQTDAARSMISFFGIRPAGQFSRFSIQTKTRKGKLKHIGGDSWRVLLRGPATVSPTMFDHRNGTYEFLFLVMDPGVYMLDITLDYSLCEGYREPPKNWFIVGNSHGKLQKEGTLGKNRARDDYLLQPFQDGKLIMINIPLPTDGGAYLINRLHRQSRMNTQCLSPFPNFDLTCGVECKFMWDGFGRWFGKNWRPYLTDISNHSQFKSTSRKPRTLWLFGDSNAERLYVSLKDGPLCNEFFKVCNLSKMWVYPWPSIQPVAWDDKDFDPQQILDHIRGVLELPEMDENSAMILNLGLHYMESTSFANYRILLKGVTELLNQREKKSGKLRYKTRVIWKTTTSMNKEKDIGSRLKSDWQRFLNPARVILYNTFATSLMCQAGLEVLDVYPFTRSYPGGTGGPEVAHYKEQDTVHFKYIAMKPIDIFLEDYFRGKVTLPIDFRNYEFS
ncbi:uncharacterized protein LOC111319553 [Stylophora pistillata]|uniref:uncharacterized protein LOC111319553 n=1 Tax=Stylophora pistillata TaxID=50429 RepID=UPI000C052359|nr:uncharacterized protein LOC111319553 [Stylophora pistillata]